MRRDARRLKEREAYLARRTPEQVAIDERGAALSRRLHESLYGARPAAPSADDYFDGLGKLEDDDDGR